jgi:hypothetical protein
MNTLKGRRLPRIDGNQPFNRIPVPQVHVRLCQGSHDAIVPFLHVDVNQP